MVSVACEELGVNLMLLPALGTSFAVAGMTSSNGRCQTRMVVLKAVCFGKHGKLGDMLMTVASFCWTRAAASEALGCRE